MKYEAIYEYSSEFSVKKMCEVLEIKTSGYYRWRQSEVKRNIAKGKELMLIRKVEKTFNDSDKTYGYRTVYRHLCNEGVNISQYKVRKIMRENGFYPLMGMKHRPIKSDRGSQYASKGYQRLLSENNIIGSMSKPGCPYDNSCMESFFATLKKCRIYRREYADIQDVKYDIFEYIETFYNRKRLHSILGYVSPVAYRLKKMHCMC